MVTRRGSTRQKLSVALDDMAAAYRQVPTDDPRFTFVAYFSVMRGGVVFRAVRGHNFGLKSAVSNFSRVPHLIAAVACRMLLYPTTHYIDDFISVDVAIAGTAGQQHFSQMAAVLGYRLDSKKRQLAASLNVALGVCVDLSLAHVKEPQVSIAPAEDKIHKVLTTIKEIRSLRRISQSEADSLLGKLQFLSSAMFSKVGRAANAPLRLVVNGGDVSWDASDRALRFLETLLPIVTPKRITIPRTGCRVDARIYSDASLDGFGVVVAIGRTLFWSSHAVTDDIIHDFQFRRDVDDDAYIADLEGLAAICGLLVLRDLIRTGRIASPRRVVHFVDNMNVLSNLISGYSRQHSLVTLMLEYYLLVADLDFELWHEWVPSKANVSDVPSRDTTAGEFPEHELFQDYKLPFVFPTPTSLWTALPALPGLARALQ